MGLSREYLERADAAPNVWVDTSALKIQVQAAFEGQSFMAPPGQRFDWDYSDHTVVMQRLMEKFPRTIVWGSDSPAYTYIVRRRQGRDSWLDVQLKGTYEEEKAALDALPARCPRAGLLDKQPGVPLRRGGRQARRVIQF